MKSLFLTLLSGLLLPLSVLADQPLVTMQTNHGTMVLELDADKAPKSVENFLKYVDAGFYDGTVFHRVIDGFMIQGGGFTADYDKKDTRPPIMNEADNGLKNDEYTLAMARTSDPHSATAQFFINVKDNDFLNHKRKSMRGWGYAVFGRVIEGKEVVDAIETLSTGPGGPFRKDAPREQVIIEKMSRVPAEQ